MTSEFAVQALIVGITAVILFDLWGWALHKLFAIRAPNWAILGRWILSPVRRSSPVAPATGAPVPPSFSGPEKAIGTVAHFGTGVIFAAALIVLAGPSWINHPTLLPALAMGIATSVFAFFIIMPALGHGMAAARAPNPTRVRLMTLLGHALLGFGFFTGAQIAVLLSPN